MFYFYQAIDISAAAIAAINVIVAQSTVGPLDAVFPHASTLLLWSLIFLATCNIVTANNFLHVTVCVQAEVALKAALEVKLLVSSVICAVVDRARTEQQRRQDDAVGVQHSEQRDSTETARILEELRADAISLNVALSRLEGDVVDARDQAKHTIEEMERVLSSKLQSLEEVAQVRLVSRCSECRLTHRVEG